MHIDKRKLRMAMRQVKRGFNKSLLLCSTQLSTEREYTASLIEETFANYKAVKEIIK